MSSLRVWARRLETGAAWKPAHLALLMEHQAAQRPRKPAVGADEQHLRAASDWLEAAQDVTGDGGICGRYHLGKGWTSSYPETTGYLIPTLLTLADRGQPRFEERAGRAVDFLLDVQLASGAFPGLEVDHNREDPAPFNTGQIIHGLTEWHRRTKDEHALEAAVRAAEWLVSVQDDDGAWRRHSYLNRPSTYSAFATCWLAELGRYLGRDDFLAAAGRHMDWVMEQRNPATGWFDLCGFSEEQHELRQAFTHTIAYTLYGVLHTCEILGRSDGSDAVRQAACNIGLAFEREGWISGVLDSEWRFQADFSCLTGNVQLALIWLRLARKSGDEGLRRLADRAIDLVKASQPLKSSSRGLRGGIPGSDPVWGDYIPMAFPNWAVKFFVDALLARQGTRIYT